MLTNPRSATVKSVARLARRSRRSQSGLFLIEGAHALIEAATRTPQHIVEVYVAPETLEREPRLTSALAAAGIEPVLASNDVIAAAATTVHPQGVVATCRQFPTAVDDLKMSEARLVVVLHEVRDPGNLGTIIRTADAAGADAVVVTAESVDAFGPKTVRASTGSLFHLPIAVDADLADVCARLRGAGMATFAADMAGTSILSLRRAGDLASPAAWVFGNEARGLGPDELALVDRTVSIPHYGAAESLNLSVAASICLYESAFALHS